MMPICLVSGSSAGSEPARCGLARLRNEEEGTLGLDAGSSEGREREDEGDPAHEGL